MTRAPFPFDVTLCTDVTVLRDEWLALERSTRCSVYQRYDWVRSWTQRVASTVGLEPRVFVLRDAAGTLGILPFALVRMGPVRMLTNLSDSHTNFAGGVFREDFARSAGKEDLDALQERVFELEPLAEGLSLCCAANEWNGLPNPLRHWTSNVSAHDAWACDLSNGLDALLATGNAKRKRKKHRAAKRAFDAAGGWHIVRPRTPEDVGRLFGDALEQMAVRFRQAGISDPFAAPAVQAFMLDNLVAGLNQAEPVQAIWALEVAGEAIAWQSGGSSGACTSLMFTVFRPGPFDSVGPGDFLLHETLKSAIDAGRTQLDLGRGAEPYKLSWCDRRLELFDVRVGRTVGARLALSAHRQATALKRSVRENERLWGIARKMRQMAPRRAA